MVAKKKGHPQRKHVKKMEDVPSLKDTNTWHVPQLGEFRKQEECMDSSQYGGPSMARGAGANMAPPSAHVTMPKMAEYPPQDRLEMINKLSESIRITKEKIGELNSKLIGTDIQSPHHRDLMNTITSMWNDLAASNNHYISLTRVD